MKRFCLALLLAGTAFSVASCGNDDDGFNNSEVTDLDVQEDQLFVGEGTVVRVDFTFDASDVFDDDENISIGVRLPNGLVYRDGTAEIDAAGGDESVGAQISTCLSTGESFLFFDLDRFDLDDADNPTGDADARLTFTVDAVAAAGTGFIQARADDDSIAFSCGEPFFFDEQIGITIN